jgi:predicted Zn finger-like uncharacterized protein
MSLVTRCPSCGTAFRVQREQLYTHSGTVRCGKCGDMFNGIAALVEEGVERLTLDPSPQLGLFDPSRRPAQAAAPFSADAPLPLFLEEDEPPARWRRWLWLLLSLMAFAALCAQLYRFRSETTVILPELRPALEGACRFAGCTVPLPRRPELIRIVSDDMHDDPNRQVYVLHVLLRNLGGFPQQYPEIELTLTDAGKPVTRRVLQPTEYLDARAAPRLIASGIEANGEEPLRVYLDARGVRASGYELCIFPNDCVIKSKR